MSFSLFVVVGGLSLPTLEDSGLCVGETLQRGKLMTSLVGGDCVAGCAWLPERSSGVVVVVVGLQQCSRGDSTVVDDDFLRDDDMYSDGGLP